MALYHDLPTDGCNIEIMGYPFYAESVSVNEAFRRREYNFNGIVSGTQKVTPGAYVGLDFTVTTHVFIDPDRPDEHNSIFQEMMSKPVEVISPELGGSFNAIVTIKPERDKWTSLKLTIGIKEIPDKESKIPGETFTVPASRDVDPNAETEEGKDGDKTGTDKTSTTKTSKGNDKLSAYYSLVAQAKRLFGDYSKKNSVTGKTKSKTENDSKSDKDKSKGK